MRRGVLAARWREKSWVITGCGTISGVLYNDDDDNTGNNITPRQGCLQKMYLTLERRNNWVLY